jgi:DNA replication and repair protein RecF
LFLRSLTTGCFRNLASQTVEFGPGVTLVVGRNGQGKTNLLEAFACLGNLRSFRGAALRKMAAHGERRFRLEGRVAAMDGGDVTLGLLADVAPEPSRRLQVDGVRVELEAYLQILPVFALSAADAELVVGPPEGRRAFLDRSAFLLDRRHLDLVRSYRRVLAQRNAALASGRSAAEVAVWEEGLAVSAAGVVLGRREVLGAIEPSFQEMYARLRGPGFPDVTLDYRSEAEGDEGREELARIYRKRYDSSRDRDRQAGFTLVGPHRHDLGLRADNRSVRDVLSAGQVKVVAAALNVASLAQVERRRDDEMPVLVDDADAEVDAGVLRNLMDVLGTRRQIVCSSAHGRSVARVLNARRVIEMHDGMVRPTERGPHE